MFDNMPFFDEATQPSKVKDELDHYLSAPLEDVKDAIAWWQQNRLIYPRLSRMALDYLTIPGMC